MTLGKCVYILSSSVSSTSTLHLESGIKISHIFFSFAFFIFTMFKEISQSWKLWIE